MIVHVKAKSKRLGTLWIYGSISDYDPFKAIGVLEPLPAGRDGKQRCVILSMQEIKERGIDLDKLSKRFARAAQKEWERWRECPTVNRDGTFRPQVQDSGSAPVERLPC